MLSERKAKIQKYWEDSNTVSLKDFSLYFLVTRLLNPLLGLDHPHPMSQEIDSAAERLQEHLDLDQLSGIGPQRLFILHKRQGRQQAT